jgi:hypothetical protein
MTESASERCSTDRTLTTSDEMAAVRGVDLMEAAGSAVARAVLYRWLPRLILVLCGLGAPAVAASSSRSPPGLRDEPLSPRRRYLESRHAPADRGHRADDDQADRRGPFRDLRDRRAGWLEGTTGVVLGLAASRAEMTVTVARSPDTNCSSDRRGHLPTVFPSRCDCSRTVMLLASPNHQPTTTEVALWKSK